MPQPQPIPANVMDLLTVGNSQVMTWEEENILTYIAGYLAQKASKRHKCQECNELLVAPADSTGKSGKYTFLHLKQYEHLQKGGLCVASEMLADKVEVMEVEFRSAIKTDIIEGNKIRGTLYERMKCKVGSVAHCPDTDSYIIQLFITVRLHHYLREQNRAFQLPKQKCSRKLLKLKHL